MSTLRAKFEPRPIVPSGDFLDKLPTELRQTIYDLTLDDKQPTILPRHVPLLVGTSKVFRNANKVAVVCASPLLRVNSWMRNDFQVFVQQQAIGGTVQSITAQVVNFDFSALINYLLKKLSDDAIKKYNAIPITIKLTITAQFASKLSHVRQFGLDEWLDFRRSGSGGRGSRVPVQYTIKELPGDKVDQQKLVYFLNSHNMAGNPEPELAAMLAPFRVAYLDIYKAEYRASLGMS